VLPVESTVTESIVRFRELRSRLRHYLRLACGGNSVVITDRDAPVGRVVPIERDLDRRFAALRAAGLLQWSGRRLAPRQRTVRFPPGTTAAELIVVDRR